jgi:Bacterial low temperature requirement A protein (LtrA)
VFPEPSPPIEPLADRFARHRQGRPRHATETVTWLELFYDLVMVAAIIVFSHGLSVQPTWEVALKTLVIFAVLWWVWLITTLLVNRDPHEHPQAWAVLCPNVDDGAADHCGQPHGNAATRKYRGASHSPP